MMISRIEAYINSLTPIGLNYIMYQSVYFTKDEDENRSLVSRFRQLKDKTISEVTKVINSS